MARWGDAVEGLLEEQGMTQAELARLAGLHPATIRHVVRGGHCNTDTLEKIAAALDVDLAELFGTPVDERTMLLKRDRVVGAVLRELSSAVSAAVLQELSDRRRARGRRTRAIEVKLPFAE